MPEAMALHMLPAPGPILKRQFCHCSRMLCSRVKQRAAISWWGEPCRKQFQSSWVTEWEGDCLFWKSGRWSWRWYPSCLFGLQRLYFAEGQPCEDRCKLNLRAARITVGSEVGESRLCLLFLFSSVPVVTQESEVPNWGPFQTEQSLDLLVLPAYTERKK